VAADATIVDAGPFDAPVIAALHSQSFDQSGWSPRSVSEVLAMPGAFGILIVVEDRPAGFLLARVVADECEILSLGVSPMAQRRGFGRRLLRAAMTRARDLAVRMVHLEVAEDNLPARGLYLGEGFTATGRRPAYYGRPGGVAATGLILSRAP